MLEPRIAAPTPPATCAPSLQQAIAIMARLRAPDGCPWDREQTFDSIKRHTLEETYEVFDAIDRRAWPDLKDELGDLLLQVLFYAQMAEEAGHFTIEDVAANLNAKLIRRHPHIFADTVATSAADVNQNWESIKQAEKATRGDAVSAHFLDEVPQHMPALLEAFKLGQRAARTGFDWPNVQGLFAKLAEETEELHAEVERLQREPESAHAAASDELGDLLFTAVNLARHLDIEPEFALRAANRKFRSRFNQMETLAGGVEALRSASPEELDRTWRQVKSTASGASISASEEA
jgi:ATP diphosphatase